MGYALRYVRNQTEEICLEAIKENNDALRYVHQRFFEIDAVNTDDVIVLNSLMGAI